MKAGYLRIFWVVLMAALLSACAAPTATDQDAARVLALGDSYTVGEGLSAEQSWSAQLSRALEAEETAVGELQVIARTGWTSEALLSALQEADPQGPYHLVTVMVGVNDQFNSLSIDAYRANLRALIERAVSLAGGDAARVIVLSIPDWSASPAGAQFALQRVPLEIARFNQVCQEEAQRAGTRYVDVTPLSLLMSEREEYSAPDGLHPSGEQYRAWVELILPEARAALGGLDE